MHLRSLILSAVLLLANLAYPPGAVHSQAATYSLFTTSPTAPGGTDTNSVELGVKFSADQAGSISSIRFWKCTAAGCAGQSTHTVSLWTSAGALLGRATSTTETASGWQTVSLAPPVSIAAGTTYVASVHTVGYTVTQNAFTTQLDAAPLHAPSSAASGGNGVYMYGSTPTFPSNTYLSSNYWIDVAYTPASALPTATATPTATSTPTPGPSPTATSTPIPTPTATPSSSPSGFTCTEFVGFSETEQWFDDGFLPSVPDPQDWQLRWFSGGSIDQWAAGSAFVGWQPASLVSHCASGSSAPDRVIFTVSGDYRTDSTWWAQQTQLAIDYVRQTYDPSVRQIAVQTVVGGPSGSMCSTSDPAATYPWVRASYNAPAIDAGLQTLLSGAAVVHGAYPQAASCADYADWAGHLNTTGARQAIGAAIAKFYSQTR